MCKFHVNREKRKVVCILEQTEDMLNEFFETEPIGELVYAYHKSKTLPNRFIGIATCSAEDTWDEDFGKRLAFQRMKKTFYTSFFSHASQFFNQIDKAMNETIEHLNNYGAKVSANITRGEKHINEYLDGAQ